MPPSSDHESLAVAAPASAPAGGQLQPPAGPAVATAAAGPPKIERSSPGAALRAGVSRAALGRWEVALAALLGGTILFGALESPNFLTGTNFFDFGLNIGYLAMMTLPLTFIVMTGEIDLSVASTLGLANAVLGYTFAHGWPLPGAMAFTVVIGLCCGLLNGVLVTRLGLPSLAVTIGTLTLYRGIAVIVLGSNSVTGYPSPYTEVGTTPLPHTQLSLTLAIFLGMAVVYAVVLHATPAGRRIVAIGLQQETAFFSGIRVKRIKLLLFVLSGAVCSIAGILYTFQNASSIANTGMGGELTVVTIVLFGGVSIFGGRGTIIGVVMAVGVLGGIQQALTLINVSAPAQVVVTGCLLLVSVTLPNLTGWLARLGTGRRHGESGAVHTQDSVDEQATTA